MHMDDSKSGPQDLFSGLMHITSQLKFLNEFHNLRLWKGFVPGWSVGSDSSETSAAAAGLFHISLNSFCQANACCQSNCKTLGSGQNLESFL